MAAKKGTWIGATVFACAAIAAGSWFMAISPKLADAADLRSQTQDVEDQNELLDLQIASLKSESAKLPEYKAELEQLRIQIPTEAQLAEYVRQINAAATARSVTVTSVTPGLGQAFVPVVVAAPAPSPTATPESESADSEDKAESDEETAPAPAAPTGPKVPDGFSAIPLSLTVVGTYDNTLAFINDLQTATPRLFLVSGLAGTGQSEAEASSGRPATMAGDQEIVLNGYLYVLPDTLTPVPAPDPAAPVPTVPAPVPGKNPLVPIAGD